MDQRYGMKNRPAYPRLRTQVRQGRRGAYDDSVWPSTAGGWAKLTVQAVIGAVVVYAWVVIMLSIPVK